MERDVFISKALSLERLMEGIVGDPPAVNRKEHILSGSILVEGHIVTEPALDPAPLIIVAACALEAVFFPALKAVDIELAHIIPDALKTLDQLAICHTIHLLQLD